MGTASSDYMYRTYSVAPGGASGENGSQVWYYSMDFGTASHVLDQSAAFDGAWRDDALFPGIALEERRKTAEIIYGKLCPLFSKPEDPNWEGILNGSRWETSGKKMVWDGRIHTEPLTEEETLNRFPDEVFRLSAPRTTPFPQRKWWIRSHRQCRMRQWRKHRISSPG